MFRVLPLSKRPVIDPNRFADGSLSLSFVLKSTNVSADVYFAKSKRNLIGRARALSRTSVEIEFRSSYRTRARTTERFLHLDSKLTLIEPANQLGKRIAASSSACKTIKSFIAAEPIHMDTAADVCTTLAFIIGSRDALDFGTIFITRTAKSR